jgi:hypothetical protein
MIGVTPMEHRYDRSSPARVAGLLLAVAAALAVLGLAPSPGADPAGSGTVAASSSDRPPGASTSPGPSDSAPPTPVANPPALAYYYMWFNANSWTHTKTDWPALGNYDSTDPNIIRQQVAWAKEAGISAFLVSWKSSPSLNLALSELVDEATRQGLKLVVVYEGLDVNRNPISVQTVESDLVWFENNYGSNPVFDFYGKPAVVWSGTWRFSDADISAVRTLVDAPNRMLLLGSEKSATDYQPRASLFDGDAYYWSSADPLSTPGYNTRLKQLGDAVHAGGGIWLAPAATGFDARLNGGTSVVDRRDGATLEAAYADALATQPDGVAIISWNEYTENSYVEPSVNFGFKYLQVLAQLIGTPGSLSTFVPATPTPTVTSTPAAAKAAPSPTAHGAAFGGPGRPDGTDSAASIGFAVLVLGVLVVLGYRLRSRSRRESRGGADQGSGQSGATGSLGRPVR